MKQRILYFLFLYLIVGTASFSFADETNIFPDQDVNELILVETDPAAGTFLIMNKEGHKQQGTLGVLIGFQEMKVIEVKNIAIVVATYEEYDWYGQTRTRSSSLLTIPKAPGQMGARGVLREVH